MIAGIHDIFAEQNSEYTIDFQYYNSSDTAIDILSLYQNVKFVVRRSSLPQDKNLFEVYYDDVIPEGYITFSNTEETYGTISVDDNQITVTVSSATITDTGPGSYFYYLNLETSLGEQYCLVKGKFVVEAP